MRNADIFIIIIIIDSRGLNARWYLTPFLLSLPTAAYLGQRGLTPAGLSHTTAQCHLTILGEAVLFCLNHLSFRTPGSLSFCCRSFYRYGRRGTTFSVSNKLYAHLIYTLSYFTIHDPLLQTFVEYNILISRSVSMCSTTQHFMPNLIVTSDIIY